MCATRRARPKGLAAPQVGLAKPYKEVFIEGTALKVPTLVRHSKRPQWGRGILVEERPTKRTYFFEEAGRILIKDGYYHMLNKQDVAPGKAWQLGEELRRKAGLSEARALATKRAAAKGKKIITLEEQIDLFTDELFDGGFEGDDWKTSHRGVDVKKRLKRHRAPLLEDAQRILSKERLDALESDADYAVVYNELVELLGQTDLVGKKERVLFADLDPRLTILEIRELLHGDADFVERQEKFLLNFGMIAGTREISWKLATLFPAIFAPNHHICVHPTSIKQQAKWMAPKLTLPKFADVQHYQVLLGVAAAVQAGLRDRGLKPADLMDVTDFIRQTLRPKARERIVEREAERREEIVEEIVEPMAA